MPVPSVLVLSLSLLSIASARAAVDTTKPAPVAIVELFTSEGCSSCPPADALLRQVNLKPAASGQLVVGLSEHVTYWDNLGWKDPYSAPIFTDRQTAYARRLSPEGPYTPQMVLNGHRQFLGSDAGALDRALRSETKAADVDLRIQSATVGPEGLAIQFAFAGKPARALDIFAVVVDDADRSMVNRGENQGRTLQHVSVARVMTRVAVATRDTEQTVHVALPNYLRITAQSGHHVVLFAQEPGQGAIVAATLAAI